MDDYNSKLVYFNINKKSYLVAYILLFLLFCIGAHRFYTKNVISAIIILILTITSILFFFGAMVFPFFGAVILTNVLVLFIWFIIDIIYTYKNVDTYNTNLAIKIGLIKENHLI